MPRNERIFAWLLTIDKSYDVLQLGGGFPQMGEISPKKMKFRMTRTVAKIFKGLTIAYHKHKLPSIRGMKAITPKK